MSDLLNTAIIILAAILHATLQLGLGSLTLLYHESAGRNIAKKTKRLVSSFISGVGIMVILLLGASCFIVDRLLGNPLPQEIFYVLIGVLTALAIIMWFFYYRRGNSTELWLPKRFALFTNRRAQSTNNDTEAFSLGLFCTFAELPIAIAPLILATSSILNTNPDYQLLQVALYSLITVAPPLIFRLAIHTGRTAVDVQKWRLRNKTFLRLISAAAFLALAAFIVVFKAII